MDVNDFHKPDLVGDVTDLSMLPSDYFDEVLAQDILEHIPRLRTERTLAEWHRLVRPGGFLRLRVPNLLALLKLLRDPTRQALSAQKLLVQCAYGTQAYEGDFHLAGFTPRLLTQQLIALGFGDVEIVERDEWLMDVSAAKGSLPTKTNDLLSNQALFVAGWHRVEQHQGTLFRWSDGCSLLNLSYRAGKELSLTFRAFEASEVLPDLSVRLSDLTRNIVLQTLQIPRGATKTALIQIDSNDFLLGILSNTTYAPGFFAPSSGDTRRLGVCLSSLTIL